MRAKIAIVMLMIFCNAEMSSLLPYVHYYLNYDYIAEVLCINKEQPITVCYGKCYLSNQLEKSSQSDDGNSPVQVELQKQPLTVNDLQQYPLTTAIQDERMASFEQRFPLHNRYIQPPTPPPQC